MDNNVVQQLAAAIQALVAVATAPPAVPAAPPQPAHVSPYKGDALDMSSHMGTGLFCDGCMALSSKFMGKVEPHHLFLADLHNYVQSCHWSSTAHGILSITMGTPTYNLLEDYGKLSMAQVETLHLVQVDLQAKQTAQLMYECVMNSITNEADDSLASHELGFHEDRPMLFFHIVNQLFMDTFPNAQAAHDKLSNFHPKQFKYDILQVNNYIHVAVKTLQTASSAGGTITEQEIFISNSRFIRKSRPLLNGPHISSS